MHFSAPNWFAMIPTVSEDALIAMVDGGGTASRAVVAHVSGRIYGYAEGASTNARAIGDDQALENLIEVVMKCANNAAILPSDLEICLITTAGLATCGQADLISNKIMQRLPGEALVATVPDTMGSWAITANLAPAVAVISGTGSVVFCGDISANICRSLGNWDYLLGDQGSGFAIGRAALQEAMRVSEGRSHSATVAEICLGHYGLDDLQDIPDSIHKPTIDKADIAALARPILDAAADGLIEAQEIVRHQAKLLANTTVAGLAMMGRPTPVVGCFGGVFHNEFYLIEFTAHVQNIMREQEIRVITDAFPLAGVFRLLLAGIPASRSFDSSSSAIRLFDDQIKNIRT
ncbi:hypothetical protein OHR68_13850 [Spirillospora sp. NBC_00431]